MLILIFVLFISCKDYPNEVVGYYPSGNIRTVKIYSSNSEYCQTSFFPNEQLEMDFCVIDGQIVGNSKHYYETGELYSKGSFENGMKNGMKKFYYKDETLKGIKLFIDDSLFYSKTYALERSDSVDQIFPVISIDSVLEIGNEFNIMIGLPFSDLFPYRDSNLVFHYTLGHTTDGQEFMLPRENFFELTKSNQIKEVAYVPQDTGHHVFFGLITINDEPLKHFSQHFFVRDFYVEENWIPHPDSRGL